MLEMKTTPMTHHRAMCGICGHTIDTRTNVSIFDNDDPVASINSIENVCQTCVYLGKEKAARQLREKAQMFRTLAADCERLAPKIEKMDNWLTLVDLVKAGPGDLTDQDFDILAHNLEVYIRAIELGDLDAIKEYDAIREAQYQAEQELTDEPQPEHYPKAERGKTHISDDELF